jgi:hypothetical protein
VTRTDAVCAGHLTVLGPDGLTPATVIDGPSEAVLLTAALTIEGTDR